MNRWYVQTAGRTVRPATGKALPGEVLFSVPTAREAAELGQRVALAEEALLVAANINDAITRDRFVVIGDAIHAQASRPADALEACLELVRTLGSIPRGGSTYAYDCWIEAGCRVLVLARVP